MGYVTFPRAIPFGNAERPMSKEQALKVLEESAELVEAVKDYERLRGPLRRLRVEVLGEAMDVYQALANLLAGEYTKAEIADAYERCVERNRERGRL